MRREASKPVVESGFAYQVHLSRSYYFCLKTGIDPVPELWCFIYHVLFVNCINIKTPNYRQGP
jgi:hypothetical protein